MSRRRACLATMFVGALFLGGCFAETAGNDQPSEHPLLVGEKCADLVIIGARGSTQEVDRNFGVGTEIRITVESLAERIHARSDTTIRLEAVRYDASAAATLKAYETNVAAGAGMMMNQLTVLDRACPDSRFALIGFSQGAQVVHVAATNVPASLASRIVLIAMIADPRHNPADDIVQWSYAERPTTGNGRLGSGPAIDPLVRRVAISLCVQDDEICNDQGAPGGPPSETHRHFYEQRSTAQATARQLDKILHRSQRG